ncbi:arabinogalactan oligomer / maltooligosaccharide transport system substrate-binding protein [Paenibacillus sophorae]|uniref:Arabinogalactan oligomer / maltooligosaccharide transport system substrate-binding protein n=1 Tax=Paenibacillus sophorae TaxID=1333845 RepID=A0A1H8K1F5_9BACL|nr:extracellular solute-binding protein [Paenibacillus sophorae]QWU13562.1 extracellular solute-binding protein [Paenibacillus sophorae]SEN86742.1 arabinogalactan oligomer / maltooligosaccharide transport system substrate-binding protein [Paenibacillus sophorae]
MTKKLGVLVLCMMLMVMLAACGGKTGSGAETTTNTANTTGNSGEEAAAEGTEELTPEPGAALTFWTIKDDFTDYAAAEFEKKYGIKVTVEDVAYWDSVARLTTDGPAGTGADVLGINNDGLGGAVKAGVILPNDYYEEETRSINRKMAVDASTIDGILYGYPRNVYTYSLYVNKDLVKDAKLETWDDIIAFSKKFNDVKNNKYGFMFEGSNAFYDVAFMTGYGGYVFGSEETDPHDIGVNNEGSIKGMEFFQKLREIMPLKLSDATRDVKTGLWEDGKLAINMDGSWNIGNYGKLPFQVEVLPLPAMPGGGDTIVLAGNTSYYVSSYSKYPNAAKMFANFITSKEMQIKDNQMTGIIPAAEGIDNDPNIRKDAIMQGFFKQMEHSRMMSNRTEMEFFWNYMGPAFDEIWNGADVKATLDKAAEGMKTSIGTK